MPGNDATVRSPRAIPFVVLGVLTVLAIVAAVVAVATGSFTSGGPSAGGPSAGDSGAAGSIGGTAVIGGDTVPVVSDLGPTSFVAPGPFAAGETTLSLPGDGPPVEVWYPADPASADGRAPATYDIGNWLPAALKKLLPPGFALNYPTGAVRGLPVADGRFPLVVFSHGFSGFRDQSTFLTSRLATWGFVVAAPDLLDHDLTAVLSGHSGAGTGADAAEIEATITLMTDRSRSSGAFSGHLDLSRIGAVGHSLGGAVSEEAAAADPRITTFIGLAGASVGGIGGHEAGRLGQVPRKPGMLMVGTSDHVVAPHAIDAAFAAMATPKRLVTLRGAGHLVFADICELAPGRGGLLAVAATLHITVPAQLVPLASDGCQSTDLPVRQGWPAIRQAVTAQLRHVFGWDRSSAGLDRLGSTFPSVAASISAG